MRFVIYGAGGIGGTIGARLHMNGANVVLIARGKHFDAMARDGLYFRAPDGDYRLEIPVFASPGVMRFDRDDVVLLCTKSQHTDQALLALSEVADSSTAIVCAQNGVANERTALRYFEHVYAMLVILPAVHLEPGTVVTHAEGMGGTLDLGCYPGGTDDRAVAIATALRQAGFSVDPDPKVMRQKYAKLLANLNNALQAAVGLEADARDVAKWLRDEALACYAAAGIDCATAEETKQRRSPGLKLGKVEGTRRGGGSSWQSLARGASDIETDYLNGEIALLGRLHGVPTPANSTLQSIARELIRQRAAPGSMTVDQVRKRIQRAK